VCFLVWLIMSVGSIIRRVNCMALHNIWASWQIDIHIRSLPYTCWNICNSDHLWSFIWAWWISSLVGSLRWNQILLWIVSWTKSWPIRSILILYHIWGLQSSNLNCCLWCSLFVSGNNFTFFASTWSHKEDFIFN